MFVPFGITVGGESDGLRGCGFVPVAFGEGGNDFPPRRTHSGHRSRRAAQWNWSVRAGGHRARGGWKPSLSLSHTQVYIYKHTTLLWSGWFFCNFFILMSACFHSLLQHTLTNNGPAVVCKFPAVCCGPTVQLTAVVSSFPVISFKIWNENRTAFKCKQMQRRLKTRFCGPRASLDY